MEHLVLLLLLRSLTVHDHGRINHKVAVSIVSISEVALLLLMSIHKITLMVVLVLHLASRSRSATVRLSKLLAWVTKDRHHLGTH